MNQSCTIRLRSKVKLEELVAINFQTALVGSFAEVHRQRTFVNKVLATLGVVVIHHA